MNSDLQTLGFAMGSAWLSGINLYITVLTLGLLQHFGAVQLPGELSYLAHTWVLIVAAVLAAIEFIADKIPAVDSVWDAVHTFIRIPAGAVLAGTAFAHFNPDIRLAALLMGGGLALTSHGAKAATRLTANASPEPFSNWILSLLGDAIALCGTLLMAIKPSALIAIVSLAVVISFLVVRAILRAFKRMFKHQPAATSAIPV